MRIGPFVVERRSGAAAASGAAVPASGSAYRDWVLGAGFDLHLEGVGIVEAIASAWERAFAAAVASGGRSGALSPDVLGLLGRSLALRGEALFVIDVGAGGSLLLSPASWWDVRGRSDSSTWSYRAQVTGPDWSRDLVRPGSGVLHFVIGASASRPWRGCSPLLSAARSLGGSVEAAVRAELRKVAAQLVSGGDDRLGDRIRQAAGARDDLLWSAGGGGVEVTSSDQWGAQPSPVQVAQLGPSPSRELGPLRDRVERSLWVAAGPAGGTARRWRGSGSAGSWPGLAELDVPAADADGRGGVPAQAGGSGLLALARRSAGRRRRGRCSGVQGAAGTGDRTGRCAAAVGPG